MGLPMCIKRHFTPLVVATPKITTPKESVKL
jgi:hypothetical protein